jgi:tRNA(Arg) A34 adenosine deaminase TadA
MAGATQWRGRRGSHTVANARQWREWVDNVEASSMDPGSDIVYLRQAIVVAAKAKAKGNHPFGAILVDADGEVVGEGENTFLTDGGPGHAETNLARFAARTFAADYLRTCVMYTSVEPCCMCAGSIYWANIGAVVYGMTEHQLREITKGHAENLTPDLPCLVVFGAGQRQIEVRGPFAELAKEIAAEHRTFWSGRGVKPLE